MFERILIPLDGSELAESVLIQVRRLLARKDAELLLLRVVTLPSDSEADAGEPLDVLWSRATEHVRNVAIRLDSEGLRVRTRVVEGFPARQILQVAKKEKVHLIAMSTHGRTGLSRWVFGSVTEKVLRSSPIPVLAVPSFVGTGGDAFVRPARELPFQRILAPIAAAELSLEVLPALTELARLFDAKVSLLHVCEGPDATLPVHEMRRAFERLREDRIPADPLVKQGDPAGRILDTCREIGADLIAMTTHGRSGVPRWLMGSVAEKVLRAATVPILVVPPARKARPAGSRARPLKGVVP